MTNLLIVFLVSALASSVFAAPPNPTPSVNLKNWRPTEFFRDPYPYFGGRYNHRDFYNNRRTFDDYFGKYRPNDVAAAAARTIRVENTPLQDDGTYGYAYETENGISMQERGLPTSIGQHGKMNGVEGSYSYTSPEGLRVLVRYTADETGYHPFIAYDGPGATLLSNNVQPADVAVRKN